MLEARGWRLDARGWRLEAGANVPSVDSTLEIRLRSCLSVCCVLVEEGRANANAIMLLQCTHQHPHGRNIPPRGCQMKCCTPRVVCRRRIHTHAESRKLLAYRSMVVVSRPEYGVTAIAVKRVELVKGEFVSDCPSHVARV